MSLYIDSGSESYSHEESRTRSIKEERLSVHSTLQEERQTVQMTSNRSLNDITKVSNSQNVKRKKSQSLADLPWNKQLHAKKQEANLDPIRNFILSQTKSKPSLPETRDTPWLVGFSDSLFSEESKEANEDSMSVCWQTEYGKLAQQYRSVNDQLFSQAEEFQVNHRKAMNRISVVETEKQKMRRELNVRQRRLEKLQRMYEDMEEDFHEIAVENRRLEKALEKSRAMANWHAERTPSPKKTYSDYYLHQQPNTSSNGKAEETVPREEFLRVVQE